MSGHIEYYIVVWLIVVGLYIVIANEHLVKKVLGLSIFQTGVFMLYISVGKVLGGTAPIYGADDAVYSNPLTHVLILTAIVVGVATTALALALIVRIHDAYGTLEEDEINALDRSDPSGVEQGSGEAPGPAAIADDPA